MSSPDRITLREALTDLYHLPDRDEAHELQAWCLLGLAVLQVADALDHSDHPIPWVAQLPLYNQPTMKGTLR